MRKKLFFAVLFVIVVSAFVMPMSVSASGGYIAIYGDELYHNASGCEELSGAKIVDLVWYDTAAQAEAYGLKICSKCKDYAKDWYTYEGEEFGDYTFFVPQNKLMDAVLFIEYVDGWESGREYGYQYALDIGAKFQDGYDEGYSDGYYEAESLAGEEVRQLIVEIDSLKESAKITKYVEHFSFAIIIALLYFLAKKDSSERSKKDLSEIRTLIVKSLRHIIAIPLGLLAALLAYALEGVIIQFLGSIPIIGLLFYYPSDASWALTVLPPATFSGVAAWVGLKIAKSAKPVSVAAFLWWAISLFLMLYNGSFAWSQLVTALVGAGTAIFCFAEFDGKK